MERRNFLKNVGILGTALALPKLIYAATSKEALYLTWDYAGSFTTNGEFVEMHFSVNPATIQSKYKNEQVDVCFYENDKKIRVPFTIVSDGSTNNGNVWYTWNGTAKPQDSQYNDLFFLHKGRLTFSFLVAGPKYWEDELNLEEVYIVKNGRRIATLKKSKDEFEDMDCFLTSACVHHKGLADDCMELTQLRHLRETYMRHDKVFQPLLDEYQVIAPKMLQKINRAANKEEVLDCIYHQLIQPSLSHIQSNEPLKAIEHYYQFVTLMKKEYL